MRRLGDGTPRRSRRGGGPIIALAAIGCALLLAATSCSSSSSKTAPPLSWQQLRNATYPSQVTPGSNVTLTNGVLESANDGGTRPVARLADVGAFGALDPGGSIDSAVFLLESTGPESWATSVIAVANDGGQPKPLTPALLGDNVLVRSAEIVDRRLTIKFLPYQDFNLDSGGTTEVTRTYAIAEGSLQLADEQSTSTSIDPPVSFRYVPEVLESSADGENVNQTLAPRQIKSFVLQGGSGQHLDLKVDASFDRVILSVQGLSDESVLLSRSAYATTFSGDLTATQGYSVNMISVSGSPIDASLTYGLTPAQAPGGQEPLPVSPPETVQDLAVAVPRSAQQSIATRGQPLATISSDAATFLAGRPQPHGVAVVTAKDGLLYSDNGDQQMETASVIKVVVMTCVMTRAEQQGRYVNEWELSLMWPMITYSDNDATDTLWSDLGGGPGVAACLEGLQAGGITPYNGPYWGTSTASAIGMASLMARLAYGEIVNPVHRAVALAMLTSVVPEQRWGIPAGADDSGREIVGVKDGWYPDDAGWRVNSVGFISAIEPGPEPYAIAVMTNFQTAQEAGIETIEGAALPVYEALRGQ